MPVDFTYLQTEQKTEIRLFLYCLKRLKGQITIPPKFVQYEIMRHVLKPQFIVTLQVLLEKDRLCRTPRSASLIVLRIYSFLVKHKNFVLAHSVLSDNSRNKCISLANNKNFWLESYYKSLFGRALSKDVARLKDGSSEVY